MPFDSGGTYSGLSNSFNDAVSGTIIDPLDWNDLFTDIESAINAVSGGVGSFAKTDIASASTCNIGGITTAVARVTGTTTITSFGTVANTRKYVYFAAALTLTHSSALVLPGAANIQTEAGSAGVFVSDASGNWRCVSWVSTLFGFGNGVMKYSGGEIRNQNDSAFYSFYDTTGATRNGYIQITATDAVIVQQNDKPLRFFQNNTERARFDDVTGYLGVFNTSPQYPVDVTGLGNFSLRPLANGKAARLNVDYQPSPTAGSNLANGTYDAFGITCVFPSGKVMMIYRQGNTHVDDPGSENDFGIIVSRTSTDGGKTWSGTTTIRSVANEDLRNLGGGVTPSGRCVLAFYRYNADTSLASNALMTSDDEGVTWSSPTEITAGVAYSPYGGLITIGDNKVALPLYGGGTGRILISSDDFATWGSSIAIGSASPTRSETSIVYLGGSTILALGRVEDVSGTVSFRQHKSTDNGATWTDQGATAFDTWSYSYGHPPWLQRFRGPDGQLKVVCYYLDRDDTTLKAVYADAKELVSTGVSAWDTNNKITIASGMSVGTSGYPAVIHAYDNPAGIGWYYNETVTDDTTEIVTLVTPTTFPTTVGGPFGGGVTKPKAAAHFAPLNQLSSVPAAGAMDASVGLFLSQPDTLYGLLAGSLNTGKGFIQAQRIDGTATTYNLQLQPNGGAVEVGSTIELGHASDTTLSRVSAGVAAIEGVNILTAATGQPLDSDLTAIAALTPTNDDIIQRKAGAWTNRTMAQLIADLGALGTTFQPLDSDLTSWAGVTRASGFDTFVATPSSANLRALITDEAGSGSLYFTGGALGTPSSGTLTNATGLPLTGLVSDTTTALGIGSINLGHASDTTIARAASGRLTVESVAIMRGPASSTDNTIARYDGTTGDLVQSSGVYIDDSNNLGIGAAPSYKLDAIGSVAGSVIGRILNQNTGASSIAAFRFETGSANCYANYELYNNSGAAYLVFGSGSGVGDMYTDFNNHHFRTQAGVQVLGLTSSLATFAIPAKLPVVAFASLPSASTVGAGTLHVISDSGASPTKGGAAGGGGSTYTLVLSNGSSWVNA